MSICSALNIVQRTGIGTPALLSVPQGKFQGAEIRFGEFMSRSDAGILLDTRAFPIEKSKINSPCGVQT